MSSGEKAEELSIGARVREQLLAHVAKQREAEKPKPTPELEVVEGSPQRSVRVGMARGLGQVLAKIDPGLTTIDPAYRPRFATVTLVGIEGKVEPNHWPAALVRVDYHPLREFDRQVEGFHRGREED